MGKALYRLQRFPDRVNLAGCEEVERDSFLTAPSSFNGDRLSLTVFRNGADKCPYLLLRIFDQGKPWYSLRGAHELCIERDGSSLHFKRWSNSEGCSKTWAVLNFATWEGK